MGIQMKEMKSKTLSKSKKSSQALGAILITITLLISLGAVVLTSDMNHEMKLYTMTFGGVLGILGIVLSSGIYFGIFKNEISNLIPDKSANDFPKTKFDIAIDAFFKKLFGLAWFYRATIALILFSIALFVFFKIPDHDNFLAWVALVLLSIFSFAIFPEIIVIAFVVGLFVGGYFLISLAGSFVPDAVTDNLDSFFRNDIVKVAIIGAAFGYYEKNRTDQFNKAIDRLNSKISQLEDKIYNSK